MCIIDRAAHKLGDAAGGNKPALVVNIAAAQLQIAQRDNAALRAAVTVNNGVACGIKRHIFIRLQPSAAVIEPAAGEGQRIAAGQRACAVIKATGVELRRAVDLYLAVLVIQIAAAQHRRAACDHAPLTVIDSTGVERGVAAGGNLAILVIDIAAVERQRVGGDQRPAIAVIQRLLMGIDRKTVCRLQRAARVVERLGGERHIAIRDDAPAVIGERAALNISLPLGGYHASAVVHLACQDAHIRAAQQAALRRGGVHQRLAVGICPQSIARLRQSAGVIKTPAVEIKRAIRDELAARVRERLLPGVERHRVAKQRTAVVVKRAALAGQCILRFDAPALIAKLIGYL
ncbi:hypothetical protein BN134_3405 [Cronobacter dublinensis 1210]|uniref:Uncharacterized protein n=1 Tax=Cronobacter dublinensis 1210 TaxID=1208656 RepID=A0ABP1WE66_9ENTR|nr:hypothetical protein BN134_3405 [Cronobacter dublinensis 1210]